MNMDNDATVAIIYEKIEKMAAKYQGEKFYLAPKEEAGESE